MMKGMIFNLQRFSLHDGPGIRTIVFLKGCRLSCPWCSNPESSSMTPDIFYRPSSCIRCKSCVFVCKERAVRSEIYDEKKIRREDCTRCGECVDVCPSGALTMQGRMITVDELVDELEKDITVYEVSGGGVTFSGGEPLLQQKFLLESLKCLRLKGINTAIETTGYTEWEKLEEIIPYTEYFLYDLKHMDEAEHERVIGVSNQIILSNFRRLCREKKAVEPRMPLIPGFNDGEKNIKSMAEFLLKNNKREVKILPYHEFGKEKYTYLNRKYMMWEIKEGVISAQIESVRRWFEDYGVQISVL